MRHYTYQADCICEDCGDEIRKVLTLRGKAPADPDDESTYDSGDFPKGPYPASYDPSDSPQHCGMGERCLNAFLGPGGRYIGVFLETPLTADGVAYVEEACKLALLEDRESSVALEIWAPFYCISLEDDDNYPYGE